MAYGSSAEREAEPNFADNGNFHSKINWEKVTCPVCLDFPHNAVLLQCSSYERGCLPFICDTDHFHSNCLGRFRAAYGIAASASLVGMEMHNGHVQSSVADLSGQPTCPLCRGTLTGWVVVDEARKHLDLKRRCCEVENCTYVGNYPDLHKHAELSHPDARPSEVDADRKLEWDSLLESSEIVDLLSNVNSEVPHGVVLGDYVVEYMDDDDTGDEFEDFPGDEGNWWASRILHHVFDNFRSSGN